MIKLNEEQLKSFLDIYLNAYPAIEVSGKEQKEKVLQNWVKTQQDQGDVEIYGCVRNNEVVGGMKIYDFKMNFHGAKMPVGGVGSVAVGLLNKKERVCKELITDFLGQCLVKGQKIAALYAFRPSFYKQMGFGYGAKNSKYRISTLSIPAAGDRKKVVFVDSKDKDLIAKCYEKYTNKNHGMMDKSQREIDILFNNEKNRIVAYKENDEIKGYLVFEFVRRDNFLTNDIAVTELVYENPDVLLSLCSFLRAQGDQIQNVIFYSQDTDFYHLFDDPRDSQGSIYPYVTHETNKDGIGIMYRVLDCEGIFEDLKGAEISCDPITITFKVTDTFLTQNNKTFMVSVDNGFKLVKNDVQSDIEVELDVSEFSSLVMGSVSFKSLYNYGRVRVSDSSYVQKISNIFSQLSGPKCHTGF